VPIITTKTSSTSIDMELLLAALSLGIMGSFHCVGMCGPIALALPLGNESRAKQVFGSLIYNAGRIATYGIFGLVFGLVGKGFVLGGYQQALSIALGLLILLGLLVPSVAAKTSLLTNLISPFITKIKSSLSKLFKQKSYSALFSIGVLNGFLPCGLVYLAVAGSIATGDALQGSAFMMAFGAGTLPAMLFVSLAAKFISIQWRNNMRKAVPVFVGLMACILILRGLNLGIPYLSPELSKTDCTQHTCCHKKK
jgi:sulfite exporter TauE/SafE